jgi:signal peptidase I
MAYGLPACSGLWLREGFTYLFRDPGRGEIVTFHARGEIGADVAPDPDSRQLGLNKRVVGLPGETVAGRNDRVFVNGRKIDDIPTDPFPPVRLGTKEYFVMGDNRSHSQDSRDFGPVPRSAIYSRAVLVVWPLDPFGVPDYRKSEVPPRRSVRVEVVELGEHPLAGAVRAGASPRFATTKLSRQARCRYSDGPASTTRYPSGSRAQISC